MLDFQHFDLDLTNFHFVTWQWAVKLSNFGLPSHFYFPVYLRMPLIFTDFPTGSGSQPCALLENL